MRSEADRATRLGDLVQGLDGLLSGPFGSQLRASEYVDEGVPVIMPRDIGGGAISTAGAARVAGEKATALARYRLRRGDILIARRGEMGRCARITAAEEGWLCGTGCLRIRLQQEVDPEYMFQQLLRPAIAAWLLDHSVGQTMPSLNPRILAELPVFLPRLATQRRVAALLASFDQAIAAMSAVNDQTRKVRRGVLRQLLASDGLRRNRRTGAAAERIPESWEMRAVAGLCDMTNGHGFKASDRSPTGLPIIRIQNLNGSRNFNYFAGIPKPGWIVETGDLLFAWAGVKGISFGPCIWQGPKGVLNQHIFRVQPRDGIVKEWLFEALRVLTATIEDRAQGFKASLVHLRKGDLMGQRVAVPPKEEQCRIAQRSRAFADMDAAERSTLEGLGRLKRGLLQTLFRPKHWDR